MKKKFGLVVLVIMALILCSLVFVDRPSGVNDISMPMPGRIHPVVTFSPVMQ